MEAAALMGAHKTYKIPGTYNDGYRAMGDAVAVPVSRYLAETLLSPLAKLIKESSRGGRANQQRQRGQHAKVCHLSKRSPRRKSH
jgi:C-5 cytosine-specific DNA methylase